MVGLQVSDGRLHRLTTLEPPRVREDIAVVCAGSAGGLHNAAHESLGAGAHVHRRGAQPELIDTDHLTRPEANSRSQARQSSAADVGQRTWRCSAPRRTSTWMCCSGVGDGVGPVGSGDGAVAGLGGAGISSATKSTVAAIGGGAWTLGGLGALATDGNVADALACLASRPARHWRTRFAFRPCASATPEIDAPGSSQLARTFALNSAP